jgi:hypothetical protein
MNFDEYWKIRIDKIGNGIDCDMCKSAAHGAWNSALQNQGAVANEPPTAAATPCEKLSSCQLPKGEACHYGPPACFN